MLNNAICNKRKQTYLDTYKMYVLHHILLNADVIDCYLISSYVHL